jgi:uncharacterized protein (DUF302 family)
MYYIVPTDKSVDAAARDLETAVTRHGFGVLHVYDLKQTLAGKGVTLPAECRIFEVCNPHQAIKVLSADMSLNMALPCRISVYEEKGKTMIGTMRPAEMLGLLSNDPELAKVADAVDQSLSTMIDEAARSEARGTESPRSLTE